MQKNFVVRAISTIKYELLNFQHSLSYGEDSKANEESYFEVIVARNRFSFTFFGLRSRVNGFCFVIYIGR